VHVRQSEEVPPLQVVQLVSHGRHLLSFVTEKTQGK